MKQKRLLTMLALLLTAVTGAWAQSTPDVVAFEVPADWQTAQSNVTVGDLPDFKAVTLEEAQAWTGFPAEGQAMLIYAFDGDEAKFLSFKDGEYKGAGSHSLPKSLIFETKSDYKYYYTYADPNAIDVTWNATTKTGTFKMPAGNVLLNVEYEPTKVTMAANDNTMGTVEVSGESKVEWTADTWAGWTSDTKTYTVDDITMTSTQGAYIQEYTANCLDFFVSENPSDNASVTFSTTGDPFTRIEFAMMNDYDPGSGVYHGIPNIQPADGWTFEGKSAVWEGEATKSLTLQSCSTQVSKITFFKGAVPDGVTVNTDGTFTVAKTATVKLTATPKEGYKFLYWDDDHSNTNPVREVTIEPGEADMIYKAVFAEILYNVTFADGIEDADKWSATPNTNVKKETEVNINYTGAKKVIGVKAAKKAPLIVNPVVGQIIGSNGKNYDANATLPTGVTAVAVIAYVGSETGDDTYKNGLAIALADEVTMDWPTAMSTCGAKTAITGAKWCLPSQDQYKQMFKANGGNEDSYTGLNAAITTAGGYGLRSEIYWTSSEFEPGVFAWFANLDSGEASWYYEHEEMYREARACLVF